MRLEEIIDIIKSSKKYNNSNFKFDINNNFVDYTIGGSDYRITIDDNWRTLVFYHSNFYNLNMKDVRVSINKDRTNKKKILAKFREVIRDLNRAHPFLVKRNEDCVKFKAIISKYIKDEYGFEPNIEKDALRVNFPNSSQPDSRRQRRRDSSFDSSREKIENVRYNIFLNLNEGNFNYTFRYYYDEKTKSLKLNRKEETYRNFSKDMTKIIRSEKLKNLMFKNEETN